mmetsp:Transcript_24343/g.28682  ORF Transcript_24343/g.28682 Transcript_24343/m.28682 type:complete len:218 (+) Transcript_24343:51-704(+)
MSNNNQILRLITILSLSFHEILCDPHSFLRELPSSRRMPMTDQCLSETSALGDIGNPATLLTDISSLLSICTVNMQALPVTADCAFPDTMAECLAGGGRHHILDLNFACGTTILITSSNFQVCGGASCDIDDFIDLTMNNVDQQLLGSLSNSFPFDIDTDTCVLNSNLTESILATPNTPHPTSGPVTPSNTSESNTIWNALSIYFLFMVAVPLLALV